MTQTGTAHGKVSAGASVRPNLTDRAKRYRAHHPDVEPGPPKRCGFCGSKQNVIPHHITGNEDHGEAQDLMWACKSCNGTVGNLMRKHGIGKLTRQYNPIRKGARKQLMAEYDAAIKVMRGTFEGDVAKAVRTIHSTPREIRSAYTSRSWPVRRQLYGSSGRQGELFENPTPATMSASAINKALDKIGAAQSKLTDQFIAAGRGHERPSEYLKADDPLARKAQELYRQRQELQIERDMRYGPGAPSRLPTGRGFGPRRSNPATASAEMYESFHGFPSQETVEFTEKTHHHDHLAALGVLIGLKVRTVSGYDVVLSFADKKQNPSIAAYLAGRAAGATTRNYIPYRTVPTEVKAYEIQGILERRGVGSRVDRVGRFGKYKYEVLVDRYQMRDHLAKHKANPAKHPLGDDPKWAIEWEKKRREEEKKNEALRRDAKPPKGSKRQYVNGRANAKKGPFSSASDFVDSTTDAVYGVVTGPGRKILKATTGALDKGVRKAGKLLKRNPSPGALCLLSSNEAGTQLFINGGDQSLDLASMKIEGHEAEKESVVVGEAWLIAYRTAKDYGDGDNATVDWIHALGPEKQAAKTPRGGDLWEDANPPEKLFGTGELPTVIYKRLDKRIELAGGIYFIKKPWMGVSPGIES